jgi:large subunit ribosomal protein L10
MSAEEFTKLADLESREVLLAKLAGAMKAKMGTAAATFNALPTQLARLAQALVEKKAAEGGTEAPEAPAAEAQAAEAQAAEAQAAEAQAAEAPAADDAEAPAADA